MYKIFKYTFYWWSWIWISPSLRHIYFRRYAVTYSKKIDWSKPIIFAPNHQSALLDALLAGGLSKKKPNFLLRADLFKKPLVIWFFGLFDMKPIYRPRDGRENMAKNEEIFEHCYGLMRKKKVLLIWPEGNQQHRYTLRQLKKGIARIALGAEQLENYSLGVQIVPIGTNYGHHWDFQTDLYVNFGDPLDIKECFDAWKRNEAEGMNAVLKKLSPAMDEVMINFKNPVTYDLLAFAKDHYVPRKLRSLGEKKKGLKAEFRALKKVTKAVETAQETKPERVEKARALVDGIQKSLKGIRWSADRVAANPGLLGTFFRTLGLLFLLPYFLFSLVMNGPIALIPLRVAEKLKDKHWHHSIRFMIGNFVFAIWYILVGLLGWFLIPVPLFGVLFLAFFLPSGFFLMLTYRWYKAGLQDWSLVLATGKKKTLKRQLRKDMGSLFAEFDQLMSESVSQKSPETKEALVQNA